jgi:type IV secretory pathway VirJ component
MRLTKWIATSASLIICGLAVGWLVHQHQNQTEAEANQRLGLPIVAVHPKSAVTDQMAVLISGDGGWADIDRKIAAGLADKGIPVVGLNALKYFLTPRTPASATKDLTRLIGHYLDTWQKKKVILIGFSLGADVLPFMAVRLPDDLHRKVILIALLAPSHQTAFEFHFSDWMGESDPADQLPTRPEVNKLKDIPLLCFYGKAEKESLCRDRLPTNVTVIPMSGGHHFDRNYASIVKQILQALNQNIRNQLTRKENL